MSKQDLDNKILKALDKLSASLIRLIKKLIKQKIISPEAIIKKLPKKIQKPTEKSLKAQGSGRGR